MVFPAERVGGVALANRCAAYHPVADLLDRALAPLLPGAARPRGQPLWPFAGRYRGTRGELELRAGGGALELLWQDETVPLVRHGRGRFVQQRGPFSEHLLRLEAAGGLAWEATTGPLRWLREGAGEALAWEGPVDAGPPAAAGEAADVAGVYTHPDFGDVRVYPRGGGDLLFAPYYAQETRLLPQGRRRFRVAGGFLAGEEVTFEPAAGEAATLAAGGMRFARRPLRAEDLQ
jgi:hypothetical protein